MNHINKKNRPRQFLIETNILAFEWSEYVEVQVQGQNDQTQKI